MIPLAPVIAGLGITKMTLNYVNNSRKAKRMKEEALRRTEHFRRGKLREIDFTKRKFSRVDADNLNELSSAPLTGLDSTGEGTAGRTFIDNNRREASRIITQLKSDMSDQYSLMKENAQQQFKGMRSAAKIGAFAEGVDVAADTIVTERNDPHGLFKGSGDNE